MKFVDTTGRVEKFQKKFANWQAGRGKKAEEAK
jgi:ribosomal protein L31